MTTTPLSPELIAEWRRHFVDALDRQYPMPQPWWKHPLRYLEYRSMRKRLLQRFDMERAAGK